MSQREPESANPLTRALQWMVTQPDRVVNCWTRRGGRRYDRGAPSGDGAHPSQGAIR